MVLAIPCSKETAQLKSGTRRLIFELSNTVECALSPSKPAPIPRRQMRHRRVLAEDLLGSACDFE